MASPVLVAVPTSLGTREPIDLTQPVLNLQNLESPQVSLLQCSKRYGAQGLHSLFYKMNELNMKSTYEEINLSDNLIGDEGAEYLLDGLEGNTTLKRLILPRAGIKSKGVHAIGKLMGVAPALEAVVLSGNYCDAEGMDTEFTSGLEKSKSMKSLFLADCRLGNAGVKTLKLTGERHTVLEHLSLAYNRLDHACVPSLPLTPSGGLRYLDLSGNSLGPEGAVAIAQILKASASKLAKLSVAQNMIKASGAKALAEHFVSAQGASLEFLDLRHNAVGYRGVQDIRTAIGKALDGDNHGWLILFGQRQLFLSGL